MQKHKQTLKKHDNKGQKKISDFFSKPNMANGLIQKHEKNKKFENTTQDIIDYDIPNSPLQENTLKTKYNIPNESSPIIRKRKHMKYENTLSKRSCRNIHDKITETNQNTSPTKHVFSSTSSSDSATTSVQDCKPKTPIKSRATSNKTPRKRMLKSPSFANEFNNHVIESFIKVTPTKLNNESISNKKTPKSNCMIQRSIDSYVSPIFSLSSHKAQSQNGITPTKTTGNVLTTNKVKIKLDFSSSEKPSVSEIDIGGKTNKEVYKNDASSDYECLLNCSWNTEWDTAESDSQYTLDLAESQRCIVVKVNKCSNSLSLIVQSSSSNEKTTCDLFGCWFNLKVDLGDRLRITAIKDLKTSSWIVDNDNGLVVYEPDLLVSCTTLVGSLFCKRRSVLKEKFQGFEPSNKYLLIGCLVHELLQKVLKNGYRNEEEIVMVFKKIIESNSIVKRLYESSTSIEEIKREIKLYVPQIVAFIRKYVKMDSEHNKSTEKQNKEDWKGKIDSVEDIEENIWCPELGLKGKIDVSVLVNKHIMPMEVKTGKTSLSLEHRGQVILYMMMMKKLGYPVSSGLLLYLKEGTLREIKLNNQERRDLMMLRNEFTYFLTRKPVTTVEESKKYIIDIKHAELPEPINHKNACINCPYNTICSSYLRFESYDLSTNGLKDIQNNVLSHLQQNHIDYFMHWNSLLELENNGNSNEISKIFSLPPEKREQDGKCISNMKITKTEFVHDCFYTTFEKKLQKETTNIINSAFTENTYITISTGTRPAVATGFIKAIHNSSITVALEKDIMKKPHNIYHLDIYTSNYLDSFNKTSLAILLEPTDRAQKLRSLIIDKKVPTFKKMLPKAVKTKGMLLKELNKIQQRAVLKAITAEDYLLIKGMPGTGKTTLIVILIQLLVELNQTVLITSQTHCAVDNICLRLKERGVKMLRIGSKDRLHPKLFTSSEHYLTKDCKTVEELEKVYNNAKVVAVTCYGSGHAIFSKRTLDVCIVDESTQILQTTVFRPLSVVRKFVLIGDPEQLPPVVKNYEALEQGLSESLFKRLQSAESTITLNMNYRMNKTITTLANAVTYDGQLLVGNVEVENAHLKIPFFEELLKLNKDYPWIVKTLDVTLSCAVQVLDTGPVWEKHLEVPWLLKKASDESSKSERFYLENPFETSVIVTLVNVLLKCGVPSNTIGVIAPYVAQISQLSSFLLPLEVGVNTVDQFQGQDKDIILYSCTKSVLFKSKEKYKFDILEDKRRLTVAITRAKHKLIIVGDVDTVKNYTPFQRLFASIEEKYVMKLQDGDQGFFWNQVLKLEMINSK